MENVIINQGRKATRPRPPAAYNQVGQIRRVPPEPAEPDPGLLAPRRPRFQQDSVVFQRNPDVLDTEIDEDLSFEEGAPQLQLGEEGRLGVE